MDKKFKILIADDEEILRDLYAMILESEIDCDFIKAKNGEEAIDQLQKNPDIDLIISDYGMPRSTGGDIYNFNKENNQVPFFLFSGGDLEDYSEFHDFYQTHPYNISFGKPFNEEIFLEKTKEVLNQKKDQIEPFAKKNFVKIFIDLYLKHINNFSDVYIKLNQEKFTKIINKNETIEHVLDLINHYKEKGIEYVYVSKNDFEQIIKEKIILLQLELLRGQFPINTFSIDGFVFQISFEGLNNIGISLNDLKRADDIFIPTFKSLIEKPDSKKYFRDICEENGDLVSHSIIIIYVASTLLKHLDLDYQTTMKKIVIASFYHDCTLYDLKFSEVRSNINSITNKKILAKILAHPIEAIKFLPAKIDFSEDIKKIIIEHHEKPDASGFPKKLTASQISVLSSLFNISQDITLCLMRNDFSKERLIDFLNNHKESYSKGNYSKIYQAACTSFLT